MRKTIKRWINNHKSKDEIFVSTQLLNGVFSKLPRSKSTNGDDEPVFSICKCVYHYTTTAVLDKILECGSLRATNVYYLNDTGEMYFGIKKIGEIINFSKENQKINLVPYTISFSLEDDLLNQWVCYGKESGVSIGFDFPEQSENGFCLKIGGINFSSTWGYPRLVRYLSKDENNEIDECQEEVKKIWKDITGIVNLQEKNYEGSENLANEITLKLLATFLKRKEFNGEKEARIVIFPISDFKSIDDQKSNISFFCGSKGILKPYIDVECVLRHNIGWPISSITVGPSGNQDAVFKSIIMRLEYGKCLLYQFSDAQKQKHKSEYIEVFIKKLHEKYDKNKLITNEDDESVRNFLSGSKDDCDKNLMEYIQDIKENECYYCEDSSIYIKKSKIPYLFT